ncbi:MAG: glycosyltransferase family 2 protein, partial [Acidimicrobiia bacterium]|nr:glycosyltransferase family 2 protein [Acidimicrobiia bacterium]
LDPTALAEDAELVVRVHRHMRESDKDYTLAFLPDPVCWTEVPNSLGQLAKQRRRWSRGLAEVLWVHRDMMFNPKFGRIGLVALPYYLLFELLGAVIEFVGVGAVLLGFAFDVVNTRMAIVVAVVALLYAMVLSAVTILIEEFSYRRYTRPRDLLNVALAGFIEIVGFRQIHAFWRTHGLISALRRTEATWEKPDREGFGSPGPEPRTPATASAS